MKGLVFALQFKGSASPAGEGRLRAKTTAESQTLRTELGGGGLRAGIEAIRGENASFESEVQITGEGTFVEMGTIAYGGAGTDGDVTVAPTDEFHTFWCVRGGAGAGSQ